MEIEEIPNAAPEKIKMIEVAPDGQFTEIELAEQIINSIIIDMGD